MGAYMEQFRGDLPSNVEFEYSEYLVRWASLYGYQPKTPLTIDEFIQAQRRWDREYEAAWDDYLGEGIPPIAAELEYLLAV